MAWNRNAEWMASRTTSLPRNENDRLLTPPLIFTPGQAALMMPRRLDEVHRVVVVLLEPGGDREDVRVEDDVGRIEAGLLGQQPVGALADRDLALDRVGLALLVEGHHDHAGAVAADGPRLVQEVGFAFLQADRVDDRLALHALQARPRSPTTSSCRS